MFFVRSRIKGNRVHLSIGLRAVPTAADISCSKRVSFAVIFMAIATF